MQTNYFASPVMSTMVVFVVEVSSCVCGSFQPPHVSIHYLLKVVTRDYEVYRLTDGAGLVDAAATHAHQPFV